MKTKFFIILCIAILAGAFALGATGAVDFKGKEEVEEKPANPDRMIGLFITNDEIGRTQSLPGVEQFQNVKRETMDGVFTGYAEESRLYAVRTEKGDPDGNGGTETSTGYRFEGVNGVPFFAPTVKDDKLDTMIFCLGPQISETGISSNESEEEKDLQLYGTIYFSPSVLRDYVLGGTLFCFYPVYQTEDGEVYMVLSDPSLFVFDDKLHGDTTFSREAFSTIENGETVYRERTKVELKLCAKEPAASVTVYEYAEDGALISKETKSAGDIPEVYRTQADTGFLVWETAYGKEGAANGYVRETAGRDTPGTTLKTYTSDAGLLIKHETEIEWASSVK